MILSSKGVVTMKVRGIVVVHLQAFIKDTFGEERYKEWLDSLGKGAREIYSNVILVDDWFPMRKALGYPLQKMCDMFYDGNNIGARYSGRYAAIYVLKSKFKHLLVHDPTGFELDNFENLFKESFTSTHIELIDPESNNPSIRIHHYPNMDEYIESRLAGWIEKGLEFNSCLYNTVEVTSSLAKGDPFTEIVVHKNI